MATPEYNITTPTGFFSSVIEPVFSRDIFSEENLADEFSKPDLTPTTNFRTLIEQAANDKDISTLEFDAASTLARQKLMSDIQSQDTYTRGKRDLEFNINAERDIQFKQGQQLLNDIDAFIKTSRVTVEQREYEKKLEEEMQRLEDEKKEELQLMAMQLGIDPNGLSRKKLRSLIATESAKQYQDKLKTDRMGSGGSGLTPSQMGLKFNPFTGEYDYDPSSANVAFAVANAYSKINQYDQFGSGNYSDEQKVNYLLNLVKNTSNFQTGGGSAAWYAAWRQLGLTPPDLKNSEDPLTPEQRENSYLPPKP